MSARHRTTIAAFLPEGSDELAGGGGAAPDAAAQAAAAEAATAKKAHDDLPQWARDSLKDANDQAAKARIRIKELEPLAAEAKTLKDAQLSETERTTKQRDDATARADAADHRVLVLEVASAKGLTPAQAKRLQGKTKEELEADADDLLANFAPPADGTKDATTLRRRPAETLRPGGGNTADAAEETDPIKLASKVQRRY